MKEKITNSFRRVKEHVVENKVVYISGGVGLVVGVAAGAYLGNTQNGGNTKLTPTIDATQTVKALKVGDVTQTQNLVQVAMVRPGPKSFVVQCVETQQLWPSVRQAAKDLGISHGSILNQINGKYPTAAGFTFVKIQEI